MTITINSSIFILFGIVILLLYIVKVIHNYYIKKLTKDPREIKAKEIDEMWYERE